MADTAKKGKQINYDYHGMMLPADMIKDVMEHVHTSNLVTETSKSGKKVSICIWGKHGIGKTSIPEQIAKEKGIGFKSIAPAQFEEMGDLLGMPGTGAWVNLKNESGEVIKSKLVDKDLVGSYLNNGWERDMHKANQMIVSPPQFVPNVDLGDPEEGFFVIDDFNRAGKRIINGIMQLLQDGGLDSWTLPPKWSIILTANPGGGNYSITELDDAQLTRMFHMSMEFEAKLWAKWALNHDIDERVVNFVLANPETIKTGELTTPRSIEYFANTIRIFSDLKENLGMVNIMGEGVLDKITATQFATFINNDLVKLVTPEELLNAEDFPAFIKRKVITPFATGSNLRVDILNVITTRLLYYCTDELNGKLSKKQMNNMKAFLKTSGIPNDLRLDMGLEIMATDKIQLHGIMADIEIGKLLLNRM